MPIEPDEQQLQDITAIAGTPADGPIVMLNLNRYRDRDEYMRYGMVAAGVLNRVGGRIQWHADAHETVIGDESDRYDEVLAVWYPDRTAFLALVSDPETVAALPHRVAGLERAAIICCSA
ncbi:MAG: hypothetical protein JWM73_2589 [Solirubrobacterales bacterium]|jgi:uncharacterized protein (DUF1330 family)|nr:hypothetical protein [Solirubrobacterales bacterium]